jgi:hypothetical protein
VSFRTDVHITGIKELLEGFTHLQGPALAKEAEKIGGAAARGTFVRAMKEEERQSIRGHGKPNRKGKDGAPYKGLDAKPMEEGITARKVRKRAGEMYAWAVGPRKFTRYWVVRGTRPHEITAGARRDGHGQIKAAGKGARALHIAGVYRQSAQHPGARPNPFVFRAASNKAHTAELEMQKAFDRYVKRAFKRASAVPK